MYNKMFILRTGHEKHVRKSLKGKRERERERDPITNYLLKREKTSIYLRHSMAYTSEDRVGQL